MELELCARMQVETFAFALTTQKMHPKGFSSPKKKKKAKRGRAVGGRRRPSSAVSKGFSQLIWARRKNNSAAAERAMHSVALLLAVLHTQ